MEKKKILTWWVSRRKRKESGGERGERTSIQIKQFKERKAAAHLVGGTAKRGIGGKG